MLTEEIYKKGLLPSGGRQKQAQQNIKTYHQSINQCRLLSVLIMKPSTILTALLPFIGFLSASAEATFDAPFAVHQGSEFESVESFSGMEDLTLDGPNQCPRDRPNYCRKYNGCCPKDYVWCCPFGCCPRGYRFCGRDKRCYKK